MYWLLMALLQLEKVNNRLSTKGHRSAQAVDGVEAIEKVILRLREESFDLLWNIRCLE
jgi:hypothetical protein